MLDSSWSWSIFSCSMWTGETVKLNYMPFDHAVESHFILDSKINTMKGVTVSDLGLEKRMTLVLPVNQYIIFFIPQNLFVWSIALIKLLKIYRWKYKKKISIFCTWVMNFLWLLQAEHTLSIYIASIRLTQVVRSSISCS